MKITKQRLKEIIKEEMSAMARAPKRKSVEEFKKDAHEHATEVADMYMRMDPNLHRQHQYEMAYKQFVDTFGDKYGLKEETDAMRGSRRLGRDVENIADEPAEDDTRDRAFASPKERLFILMNAREALNKMTSDELAELSLSLDADMVASLRHILANPMYAPIKESNAEAQDLIRKAEFEEEKGRLHQGDVDRIKDRLAKGERVHAIKRDYPRNFPR